MVTCMPDVMAMYTRRMAIHGRKTAERAGIQLINRLPEAVSSQDQSLPEPGNQPAKDIPETGKVHRNGLPDAALLIALTGIISPVRQVTRELQIINQGVQAEAGEAEQAGALAEVEVVEDVEGDRVLTTRETIET